MSVTSRPLTAALEQGEWAKARSDNGLPLEDLPFVAVIYPDGGMGLGSSADDAESFESHARHQLAAICLAHEPFGFTERDTSDEINLAIVLEKLSRLAEIPLGLNRVTLEALAQRLRFRAARIAALQYSTEAGRNVLLPPRSFEEWQSHQRGDFSAFWELGQDGYGNAWP